MIRISCELWCCKERYILFASDVYRDGFGAYKRKQKKKVEAQVTDPKENGIRSIIYGNIECAQTSSHNT